MDDTRSTFVASWLIGGLDASWTDILRMYVSEQLCGTFPGTEDGLSGVIGGIGCYDSL